MRNIRITSKIKNIEQKPVSLDLLKSGVEVVGEKKFKSLDDAKKFYDSLDSYKDAEHEMYTWENPHLKNTEGGM